MRKKNKHRLFIFLLLVVLIPANLILFVQYLHAKERLSFYSAAAHGLSASDIVPIDRTLVRDLILTKDHNLSFTLINTFDSKKECWARITLSNTSRTVYLGFLDPKAKKQFQIPLNIVRMGNFTYSLESFCR